MASKVRVRGTAKHVSFFYISRFEKSMKIKTLFKHFVLYLKIRKEKNMKIITKCDKKISPQKNSKVITKCDRTNLLQSVTKSYYKVCQLLQSVTKFITKSVRYCKV